MPTPEPGKRPRVNGGANRHGAYYRQPGRDDMGPAHTRAAVTTALVMWAAAAHAAEGVLITQRITSGTTTTTNQSQIEKTRMRSETASANGS